MRRSSAELHIFPITRYCLRLICALVVEIQEKCVEDSRHLTTTFLTEQKKESLNLDA